MAKKPILYYVLESPPCQTVLAVARLIGVELDLKLMDFATREHTKEPYATKVSDYHLFANCDCINHSHSQVNPFQTLPGLVEEDGFALGESRAISAYLVQSHKPSSSLYPQELKRRSTVDWMLQIDLGTLFPAISDVVYEIFISGDIAKERIPRLEETLKKFNAYLADRPDKFVTGESEPSIADVSIHFHWILLGDLTPEVDISPYSAIAAWNAKVEKEVIAKINEDGLFDKARANVKAFTEEYRKKK